MLIRLILLALITATPHPATLPTGGRVAVHYDSPGNRSTVSTTVGSLVFRYSFDGPVQTAAAERIEFHLKDPLAGDTHVEIRTGGLKPMEFNSRNTEGMYLTPAMLKQIAESKAVRISLRTPKGRTAFWLTDRDTAALSELLDRTRYFSPEAVAARRQAEEVKRQAAADKAAARQAAARREWEKFERLFIPGADRSVVYLLDHSGSMIDKLEPAQSLVQKAIRSLPPDTPVNVIVFRDQEVLRWRAAVAPADDVARQECYRWLQRTGTAGSTETFLDGLVAAAAQQPGRIVLLTDADITGEQMEKAWAILHGTGIKLNVLVILTYAQDLGADRDAINMLRQAAEATGGEFAVKALDATSE